MQAFLSLVLLSSIISVVFRSINVASMQTRRVSRKTFPWRLCLIMKSSSIERLSIIIFGFIIRGMSENSSFMFITVFESGKSFVVGRGEFILIIIIPQLQRFSNLVGINCACSTNDCLCEAWKLTNFSRCHTNLVAMRIHQSLLLFVNNTRRIMDELDHEKIIKKIIYKELEPSVLNQEIITRAIYDQGPDGEAGRLFREMEIQYEKVTVLRLEFLSELNSFNLNNFKEETSRHSQNWSSLDPAEPSDPVIGVQQNRQNWELGFA